MTIRIPDDFNLNFITDVLYSSPDHANRWNWRASSCPEASSVRVCSCVVVDACESFADVDCCQIQTAEEILKMVGPWNEVSRPKTGMEKKKQQVTKLIKFESIYKIIFSGLKQKS